MYASALFPAFSCNHAFVLPQHRYPPKELGSVDALGHVPRGQTGSSFSWYTGKLGNLDQAGLRGQMDNFHTSGEVRFRRRDSGHRDSPQSAK
jgi:hypothetical protein